MFTTHPATATSPVGRAVPTPVATAHGAIASVRRYIDTAIEVLAEFLTRWSVPALRVALGFVFLSFGALKLLPDASPAAAIAQRTVETLTFGVVHGTAALVFAASLEIFIGITLLTGRLLKAGLLALVVAMVGILSPLVLFFGELFGDGVTLMGQYVIKDIVLVTGASVVAAVALGARLRRDDTT